MGGWNAGGGEEARGVGRGAPPPRQLKGSRAWRSGEGRIASAAACCGMDGWSGDAPIDGSGEAQSAVRSSLRTHAGGGSGGGSLERKAGVLRWDSAVGS